MPGNIYNQLAVANLSDGRLQLWSVDENLAVFSGQQETTDPIRHGCLSVNCRDFSNRWEDIVGFSR